MQIKNKQVVSKASIYSPITSITDPKKNNSKKVKNLISKVLSAPAVLLIGGVTFNNAWAATCAVNMSVSTPCTDLFINLPVLDIVIDGSVKSDGQNRAVQISSNQNSFTNNSSVSGTDTGIQITSGNTTSLINTGLVVGSSIGLANSATIGTLTNTSSGAIQGGRYYGLLNSGTINIMKNTGTMKGGNLEPEGIHNLGTISTLVNGQGQGNSAGALTYEGVLPTNYNILFSGSDHYGKFTGTTISGSMFFGIDLGSIVSSSIYTNVLSGFTSSNLIGGITGTYGDYSYELKQRDNSTIWDLLFPDYVSFTDIVTSSNALSAVGVTLNPIFDGGSLILNDGDSSALDFTLNGDGGTLNTATGEAEFSGIFSGTGALSITGAGTLTLSGTNTYTGNTIISDGTLKITRDVNLGDSSGGIVLNGGILNTTADITSTRNIILNAPSTITTDTNTTFISAGELSGTSALTKNGDGILTLAGTNTHTGVTNISAGTLQIGNGGTTGSISGNIVNNSALSFNRSDDITFANAISGSGTFTQNGRGNTTLTGVNTYTGDTTINNGVLTINGSIANSDTFINNDAKLKGSGILGDVFFRGAGILAPGNSIGTINVNNINFGGGIYEVEVDATGNSDLLNVSGAAILNDGIVSVLPAAGQYAFRTNYTILTANSLVGNFDSVSIDSNFAFLDAALSYDANNVVLSLQRNDSAFETAAQSPNQRAVGGALTAISQSNPQVLEALFDNLTVLSTEQSRNAFDSLSGVQHASTSMLAFDNNQRFINLLNNRTGHLMTNSPISSSTSDIAPLIMLAYNGQLSTLDGLYATSANQNLNSGWWLTPQYSRGDIDSDSNARGTDFRYSGITAGLDRWVDDSMLVGVALNYGSTKANDVNMKGFDVAMYGRWLWSDEVYVNAIASLGRSRAETERDVIVGITYARSEGDYDLAQRSFSLEAGKVINVTESFSLTPFMGVQYTHFNREGFTEKGNSGANLKLKTENQESIRSQLGVRTAKTFMTSKGVEWVADAQASWIHEFADDISHLKAAFAAAPASQFTVAGPQLNRDRALIGVGITTIFNERASVRVGYEAETASTDGYQSAFATFKYML